MTDIDQLFHRAFARRVAQSVFDIITQIANKPQLYNNIWIWELLQNARDAAGAVPVNASVSLDSGGLTFQHDGAPFTYAQLVQLIVTGSTKRDELDKAGRFGTGFITSHRLSKVVEVSGSIQGGPAFRLPLDREAKTAAELESKMEVARDLLKKQSEDGTSGTLVAPTVFRYPFSDSSTRELASSTIDGFDRLFPYVLAFNVRLSSLHFVTPSLDRTYRVLSRKSLASGGERVSVETARAPPDGKPGRTTLDLVVWRTDDSSLAIPLVEDLDGFEIGSLEGIPRLFAFFPLVGTDRFPLSFVVSSDRFQPLPERRGIHLRTAGAPETDENRKLLEGAIDLFQSISTACAKEGWDNLLSLLEIPSPRDEDWIDPDWLFPLLRHQILERAVDLPLTKNREGKGVSLKEMLLMIAPDARGREALRGVVALLEPSRVPDARTAERCDAIADLWTPVYPRGHVAPFNRVDVDSLSRRISGLGSVDALASAAGVKPEEILRGELANYLKYLAEAHQELLGKVPLLPDQNGVLCLRNALSRDPGLDSDLKLLSKELAFDFRSLLLAEGLPREVSDLLRAPTEAEFIDKIVSEVRNRAKSSSHVKEFQSASAGLLAWLLKRSDQARVQSYPAVTIENETELLADTSSFNSRSRFLVPPSRWPAQWLPYRELFSPSQTLSECYSTRLGSGEFQRLEEWKFVFASPRVVAHQKVEDERELNGLLSSGLLKEGTAHSITLNGPSIFGLTSDGAPTYERIRSSRARGVLFIELAFNTLMRVDSGWDTPVSLSCSCGESHSVYPSPWFFVMRTRRWVHLSDGNRSPLDASSLAQVLSDRPDLQTRLTGDEVQHLLRRMGISIGDVARNLRTTDAPSRSRLDKAIARILLNEEPGSTALDDLVEIATNKGLRDELHRLAEAQRRVDFNRWVGLRIEELLRGAFEKLAVNVEKIHKGGDFKVDIEHDCLENGSEVMFKVGTHTFEVKSTVTDSVGLTPAQAENAVAIGDRFVLCVVDARGMPIEEDSVKSRVRFVFGLHGKLKPLVDGSTSIKMQEQAFATSSAEVQLSIERETVRFRVQRKLWEEGVPMDSLSNAIEKAHPALLAAPSSDGADANQTF